MSVLLCRQKAERPFRHDKLNINLWSEQELCYVIYHYPLLCLESFAAEPLFSWIERELQRKDLAEHLRQNRRDGESAENQLLTILQECTYYDVNEVRAFSERIQDLKRRSPYEIIYMEGRILYEAGKYHLAFEKMEDSIKELDQEFRRSREDKQMDVLLHKKADIYCDLAVIALKMFDDKRALELLTSARMSAPNLRAERMQYLINGSGELSDAEKQELDDEKSAALAAARESDAYRQVEELFEKDKLRIFKDAAQMVKQWKNLYRSML